MPERKTVLERPKPPKALSSQDYRNAMSHLAGAVNIVSTDGPAGKRGVTVSAVVSVSDSPPTMLVCLNRNREENRFFEDNGCFAISTLCADQIELARAFAGEGHLPMAERFALGKWNTLATGAPVLDRARMSLDCVVTDVQAVHTHYVIFGQIVAAGPVRTDPELIYLDRHYRSI